MRRYVLNLLYALDILLNTIFGGERHQTISARWGDSPTKTWLYYWGCRALNWFDKSHCERSRAHYEKIRKVNDDASRT